MKINVVIDSISRAAGGLFDAERRLHQELAKTGAQISVFSLEDEFSVRDSNEWLPVGTEFFPTGWPGALGRSSQLRARLLAEPADLLYRAGLWKWPSRNAREWSREQVKPEIIAPHGMLDPWAVKNSAWKKRLALMLYEREHLENATCIRALCEAEAGAIRQFGLKNPIAVIPNGVDLPQNEEQKTEIGKAPWNGLVEPGRKVLLFLSRIHRKKGLVNLLRAWKQALNPQPSTNNWLLAIAGWDQGGHEDELKRMCDELGIRWMDARGKPETLKPEKLTGERFQLSEFQDVSVLFLGPQFGEDKAACFRNCDAFILPSFSEGVPMVVLEAWAQGKVVLMTPECNLPEGFAANAAIRIETTSRNKTRGGKVGRGTLCSPSFGHSIEAGLRELFAMSDAQRQTRGANGYGLVQENFAWPKIAADMKSVYQWVLGGGTKPECVVQS